MVNPDQIESERQRFYSLVDRMLEELYDGETAMPADLRLDMPLVLGMYVWTDADNEETENVVIYSGTRRNFVTLGLLTAALQRVKEGSEGVWITDEDASDVDDDDNVDID